MVIIARDRYVFVYALSPGGIFLIRVLPDSIEISHLRAGVFIHRQWDCVSHRK